LNHETPQEIRDNIYLPLQVFLCPPVSFHLPNYIVGGVNTRVKIPVLTATAIMFLALLLFASSIMIQLTSASTTPWPNWRNHSGNTASTNVGPTANLTLWTTAMNGSSFAPVANWGKVFLVHYPAYVTAYDAATGIKIWEVDESGQAPAAPATGTASDGTNIVLTENFGAYVTAYRADDGALMWRISPPKMGWGLGAPIIHNGVAYVEDFKIYGNGHVYAINITTGTVIWTYTFSTIGGRPIWGGSLTPCINALDGIVYATGYGKSGAPGDKYSTVLAAINMSTGAELWVRLLNSSDISTHCSPVYSAANGYVYAGDNSGNATCWNAVTGTLVWSGYYGHGLTAAGLARGISPMALDESENMLLFTSGNHTLWSLNALTGAVNWAVPCNSTLTGGPIVAVGTRTVYLATGGTYSAEGPEEVRCYNITTGALIWSYKTGAQNKVEGLCSPALADQHLFFVSGNISAAYGWSNTTCNLICFGLNDITLTGITLSKNFAYQNETIDIDVTVRNNGAYSENFTVTCYVNLTAYLNGTTVEAQNMTAIGAQSVTLAAGTSTIITFPLNCVSYALGYYTVSANASTVPGETHTEDNSYTDGTIVVALTPFHDVTISSVTPSRNIIGQGYSLTVNVTAANLGTYDENFTVTCYANSTLVGAQDATLTQGTSTTITFIWNTTGYALGYYTVSANASVVPGETHTEDNAYVNGAVKVTTHNVTATDITSYSYISTETDNATHSYSYHITAINVTVENSGLENETFNVYAISSGTWNATVANVFLAPGTSTTIQFIWDTRNTPPGTYTVTGHAGAAADQGVNPEESSITDNSKTIAITIDPTYTLTVRVMNNTGTIIYGANVTVDSSWSLTNLTGYAVFPYLPQANYNVSAFYSEIGQTSQTVSLTQDKTITLTITPPSTPPSTETPWLLIVAVIVVAAVIAICVGVALHIMKKPKQTAPTTPKT
jgi:outer membrane protein assembly factor BamB